VEPPFKAKSREELAKELEEQIGKPPVFVAIPILSADSDSWTPLLTTLRQGYDVCFREVHPNAINEFGHTQTQPGVKMSNARRWDQPSQPLVECVIRYYTENDVPGADGRPLRISLDPGTAAELTNQVAQEREALLDQMVSDETALEEEAKARAEPQEPQEPEAIPVTSRSIPASTMAAEALFPPPQVAPRRPRDSRVRARAL
jgi:hypothetical protein